MMLRMMQRFIDRWSGLHHWTESCSGAISAEGFEASLFFCALCNKGWAVGDMPGRGSTLLADSSSCGQVAPASCHVLLRPGDCLQNICALLFSNMLKLT